MKKTSMWLFGSSRAKQSAMSPSGQTELAAAGVFGATETPLSVEQPAVSPWEDTQLAAADAFMVTAGSAGSGDAVQDLGVAVSTRKEDVTSKEPVAPRKDDFKRKASLDIPKIPDEQKVAALEAMGFSRGRSKQALEDAKRNFEHALAILLSASTENTQLTAHEDKVAQLVGVGFAEEPSVKALEDAGGNFDAALAILLSHSS